MLQSSINEYIQELGYDIKCFSDGMEANNELERNEYDLLLLDINVPGFSGLQILKKTEEKTITLYLPYS